MAHGDFDCDTELCLTPGGRQRSNTGLMANSNGRSNAGDIAGGEQQQEITMLYGGGQACVGDVTEIQARAILCMVRREMKEKMGSSSSQSSSLVGSTRSDELPPPLFSEPLLSNPGLSMKRSLQRFLQKRKTRVYDSIPYQPQKKDYNMY